MSSKLLLSAAIIVSVHCNAILHSGAEGQDRYPLANSPPSAGSTPESFSQTARLGNDSITQPRDGANFFEPTRILASVAGDPIFVGDLIGDVNLQIEKMAAKAPESVKEQARQRLVKQMLPLAIEQKLVYIDMARTIPDPKRVTALRKDIKDQFDKLQLPRLMEQLEVGSREELDAKLREYDTSLRGMREKWVDNQMVSIYIQQFVNEKPSISRQDMLDKYNENKADYSFPEQVLWEELMISNTRAGGKDKARKEIAELGNEVIYGAKLSELAKERSHGYGAKKGGQHDWTTRGTIKHEQVDKLLFELPVNFLSDIIETEQGFHIVRVLQRKEAGHIPFSEAQAKIKQIIEAEFKKKKLAEYLEKLKRELPVEIYDDDVAKSFLR